MKIYIAGKIRGDAHFKDKFEVAKKKLEDDQGYIVLNPADLPAGMSQGDYMRICISMIDVSDVVYFLNDHWNSQGARVELAYSEYIGKEVRFEKA